jgi:hypothetical protein
MGINIIFYTNVKIYIGMFIKNYLFRFFERGLSFVFLKNHGSIMASKAKSIA